MKKMITAIMVTVVLTTGTAWPEEQPAKKSFDQTDAVLARARAVEDIEYKIMVQRATQTAIYYMPAAGMVDFVKGIRRDLGGDVNDVVYLNKPLGSDDGFLTANDVTAYCWSSLSSQKGPIVVEVPPATDKVSYFGPKAPKGNESNWIPTGEDFFLLFRLYGPESKDFYKTWMLGDLEKVK